MNIFDLLQLIGGIILSVGYIPQIIQIRKEKNSDSFNTISFASVFTGILLMEIYAVNLYFLQNAGLFFFITNSMALIVSGILFLNVLIYKKK